MIEQFNTNDKTDAYEKSCITEKTDSFDDGRMNKKST